MKIKNRRWHKKRYLETNILNSVSKGKILKQVDIKVPEKYLNDGIFLYQLIEKENKIKVLKLYTKLTDNFKYMTIMNKKEYDRQLKEASKSFKINFNKTVGKSTYNFLDFTFIPKFTPIDEARLQFESLLK